MSTRSTIAIAGAAHLYYDVFDDDHVWLEVGGGPAEIRAGAALKEGGVTVKAAILIADWDALLLQAYEEWERKASARSRASPTFELMLLDRGADGCAARSSHCEKPADYSLRLGTRKVLLCADHLQGLKRVLNSPAEAPQR